MTLGEMVLNHKFSHRMAVPLLWNQQSGLTLLEIMITVVILSLGLLGLAGLQMTGLKNNRNAYYNSIAGQAVQNIAERLRVDQATRDAIAGNTIKDLAADSTKCAAGDNFDDRVKCAASALPGGRALVKERSASPKAFYVALTWTDLQLDGAKGWAADTATNPAEAACGDPDNSANTSCYYTVFRP